MNPKRTRRPSPRRHHILKTSLQCFASNGYEETTYDTLIRNSNVSRGSFYWYFPSKEKLYLAVLTYCLSDYEERLESYYLDTDPKDHFIRRLLETALRDFREHREKYRLLCRPAPSAEAAEKMREMYTTMLRFVETRLQRAVRQQELPRALVDVLPDVIVAVLDGMYVRDFVDQNDSDERTKEVVERAVQVFLACIDSRKWIDAVPS